MFNTASPKPPQSVVLVGPSGSGKTRTALALATAFSSNPCVIDAGERGSSGGYAPLLPHASTQLGWGEHGVSIKAFLAAMDAARSFEVVVVDSLSALWLAVLSYKEALDGRGGNTYTNWGKATKVWDSVLTAIQSHSTPVVVTVRSKMAYAIEERESGGGRTRNTVAKLGLQPIWRDTSEYAFDILCSMHNRVLSVDQPRHLTRLSGLELCEPEPSDLLIFWEGGGDV